MKTFTSIPFLRILLPFVPGILTGIYLDGNCAVPLAVFIFPFIALIFFLLKTKSKTNKRLFVLAADLFLFFLGIQLTYTGKQLNDPFHYSRFATAEPVVMSGIIHDIPARRAKTTRCELRLNGLYRHQQWQPVTGKMYVYVKQSVRDSLLRPGAQLVFGSVLKTPLPAANPGQFDYAAYLERKQIFHTALVDSGAWQSTHNKGGESLWLWGLFVKHATLNALRQSGLTFEAYTICAALLTGYDEEIDRGIMEAFSHTGTLHVLSVSGLHTGLIYLSLVFIFNLFDRHSRHKVLRFYIITLLLWAFALITGFSAPVLRAVIMLTFLGAGSLYFRSSVNNQINILSVSAFLLLYTDPYLIADVGFLLSFLAMAGIFCFQPVFDGWWEAPRPFIHVWQNITVSFAATLSTLPVTLFYFKQFPIWFFLCNLVVVPLTFVILMLSLLVLLKIQLAVWLVNLCVEGLIWFIQLFSTGGYTYVDHIDFTASDAILLSLLILFFALAFKTRSYSLLRTSMAMLILWQLISLFDSFHKKNSVLLSVYHLQNSSVYMVKNASRVHLNADSSANLSFYVKPHLVGFNYPEISGTVYNYCESPVCSVVFLRGKDGMPLGAEDAAVMVLSHNAVVQDDVVRRFRRLRTIVADGSNNMAHIRRAVDLCRKFGLEFFSTRQQGAFLLQLNETEDRRQGEVFE